jgi:hypothetical protein
MRSGPPVTGCWGSRAPQAVVGSSLPKCSSTAANTSVNGPPLIDTLTWATSRHGLSGSHVSRVVAKPPWGWGTFHSSVPTPTTIDPLAAVPSGTGNSEARELADEVTPTAGQLPLVWRMSATDA